MTTDHPPPSKPTKIELQSLQDSKIVGISLYSTRAEITRLYKFAVKTGQNQVTISGLPDSLESESLRVEGRGAATIHDVTVSMAKGERVSRSSPRLSDLLKRRETKTHALMRCEKSLSALEQYMGSLTVQHLEVSKLEDVLEKYESTGERLDAKKAELTEELRALDAEIGIERAAIALPHENDRLRTTAAIGVFAQKEGNVEIVLVYAVPFATWTAVYDIRVDMDTKKNPIKLVYKAAVRQNSGEPWDDVQLRLETSTPTFGVGVPSLSPWNLQIYQPPPVVHSRAQMQMGAPQIIAQPSRWSRRSRSSSSFRSRRGRADSMEPIIVPAWSSPVISKGNVSATFRVPGVVSVPSDGDVHNFTIVELSLQAEMSWLCVPKVDTKTHLNAHITNASEYALLEGMASIYVDGSFISRSTVPAVSPQESFNCPLGLDPSIRITYHPVVKKLSKSGFYNKTAKHIFSQRITVSNMKSVAVERLKIVDQIPISQNEQIEVNLVSPALSLPSELGSGVTSKLPKGGSKGPQALNVGKGVVAQWDGVDDPGHDAASLGLDHKLNWVCTVPAQGKVNLALEWEVTVSPASAQIVGL
ncbi:hypothetical protein C8R43DRAFT_504406 [Mycena crocata]|nr:hypothetical protein C8R43DRAFT_504406 [Mycena crocata]